MKQRRLTLKMVRDVLRVNCINGTAPLTDEQLALACGMTVATIRQNIHLWIAQAAGVRIVRAGPKEFLGWSYMPPEEPSEFEPATPTIEQLEAEIVRLKALIHETVS